MPHLSRRHLLALALGAAAAPPRATARAPQDGAPAALVDELARHRYPLTLENGSLGGEGARVLSDEARAAAFVLVGEDHGLAEMPRFVDALFRLVAPHGYRHLAVEAGPVTGRYLTRMASAPDAERAFADFNREHPFALPFYSWREEAEMLASAVRAAGPATREPIWALDQEFILSASLHLARLVDIAPNARARAVAAEYAERARTEFARMVEAKDPGVVFLVTATADDFKRLGDAYRAPKGSEAARLLDELEVSWEIYQKNFTGRGFDSNQQRADLMKRHLMEYYERARTAEKAPPKAVFKFGAYHMKRGRSYINVYDVGNLVSELAAANGSRSFHVLAVAAKGTQNTYLPFVGADADRQKPYDAVAAFDFMDVKPLVGAAAGGGAWTLVDLRPLRPLAAARKLGALDRGLEETIWGYDAAVVVPAAHASTLFEWTR
jgi:hypothetical protein